MKTLIVTLFAVVSLVLAGMAFADSSGSSASPCGAVHGAFADVNGNFGFLGDAGPERRIPQWSSRAGLRSDRLQQLAHGLIEQSQ